MEKQSVEEKTSANNLTSSKLYENERSIEMSNDSQLVEQSSITAMQTSLILMKLEMIKPSMENAPSTNSEKAFSCIEENTRVELPSMKFTISCDTITTQAVTPYSSSMSTSTLVPSRDILQISAAPLSSIGSIPKSEILTFTTDYNNRSPDACSVLVDVVDQHDPSSTFNRDVQLSIEESFDLPQRSISSVRNDFANRTRQSRQTWRFGKCLCCTAPIDDEIDTLPHSRDAPPTYSSIYVSPTTILHQRSPVTRSNLRNNGRFIISNTNQSSFIAPIPPPSYAQAQGIQLNSYSTEQNLSVSSNVNSWSARPVATICTRCLALIVTTTEVRRSTITHLSAFLLCLCGCWPCCMIPYCLNSCKSTDHYCPVCHTYLGTYTPW